MGFKKSCILLLVFAFVFFTTPATAQQQLSPEEQKSYDEFRETVHDLFSLFRVYEFPSITPPQISGAPAPTAIPGQAGSPNPSLPPPSLPQKGSSSNAILLYEIIKSNCGGVATAANPPNISASDCYSKVKNIDVLKKNGAEQEMHISIYQTKYWKFQCVGLAKTVSRMNGATWNISHGEAANYARNTPPSGFRFVAKGTTPIQIGDFPIWDRDSKLAPSGHIAVVSNVFADGNTFEVVEANLTGHGEVTMSGTRRVNGSDYWATKLLGWYRRI